MTAEGEFGRIEPVGGVVSEDGQLTTQQSRAEATSGVLVCSRALAQQSISPSIPPIAHPCCSECRGMPASTLLASTRIRTRDVSHFTIDKTILSVLMACQGRLRNYVTLCGEQFYSDIIGRNLK